ncbi:hypothetical protein EYF80_021020 [Liparis tanakae]|uniref:Uncharacterized protein n=1 Tax=Liparis tanakae TaxID=230148 RepID=A0A4Z2HSG8_9TELE|nr:hypothetical protein EYF80_021020 [Liparis tanakae]
MYRLPFESGISDFPGMPDITLQRREEQRWMHLPHYPELRGAPESLWSPGGPSPPGARGHPASHKTPDPPEKNRKKTSPFHHHRGDLQSPGKEINRTLLFW